MLQPIAVNRVKLVDDDDSKVVPNAPKQTKKKSVNLTQGQSEALWLDSLRPSE